MNPGEPAAGVPLTKEERARLRNEVDADALSQLFLHLDPEMRQLTLSLVQRTPPEGAHLVEPARNALGDTAAEQIATCGPRALWIEFPDDRRNQLWRRALGIPNVSHRLLRTKRPGVGEQEVVECGRLAAEPRREMALLLMRLKPCPWRAAVRVMIAVLVGSACMRMPIGKAGISVRGRVAGHAVDRVFGRLACEHGGWVNVYDERGNVLVFAPREWKPVVGAAEMESILTPSSDSHFRSNVGWINAAFTNGFSVPSLAGSTTVTAVSDTEVSGQVEWIMGFPGDSGRLVVAGAFRAKRGCPGSDGR